MTTDVVKLQEMLKEAIEAGREAQQMVNILQATGVKLDPWSMARYNTLYKSCASRTRKINEFTDSQIVNI